MYQIEGLKEDIFIYIPLSSIICHCSVGKLRTYKEVTRESKESNRTNKDHYTVLMDKKFPVEYVILVLQDDKVSLEYLRIREILQMEREKFLWLGNALQWDRNEAKGTRK